MDTPVELQPGQPPPQQILGMFNICWDELKAELRKYARPLGVRKPVSPLGNLVAETSIEYKLLKQWEVAPDSEGILHEISLFTSRSATSMFKLVFADETKFEDSIIHSGSLTIPYNGLSVASGNKVSVYAKTTDAVATNFDAIIIAEERYYQQ
ncbi:hypothetical protein ES703_91493 [subsurface metagenome]